MTFSKIQAALAVPVVMLAVALPAAAQAHTTIIEPPESHHPYQQWVDESLVPTPDLTITVSEGASTCEPGASACTDAYSFIDILVENDADRLTFLHELGHVWDAVTWDDGLRGRYLHLIRQPWKPWWPAQLPAEGEWVNPYWAAEWFADNYATCAVRARFPKGTIYRAANGLVGPPAMRKICRLIRFTG